VKWPDYNSRQFPLFQLVELYRCEPKRLELPRLPIERVDFTGAGIAKQRGSAPIASKAGSLTFRLASLCPLPHSKNWPGKWGLCGFVIGVELIRPFRPALPVVCSSLIARTHMGPGPPVAPTYAHHISWLNAKFRKIAEHVGRERLLSAAIWVVGEISRCLLLRFQLASTAPRILLAFLRSLPRLRSACRSLRESARGERCRRSAPTDHTSALRFREDDATT